MQPRIKATNRARTRERGRQGEKTPQGRQSLAIDFFATLCSHETGSSQLAMLRNPKEGVAINVLSKTPKQSKTQTVEKYRRSTFFATPSSPKTGNN